MKKWWIGALVLGLLLATLIAWSLRQSHAITVVTHGRFEVYDVLYFPATNRIFYWRYWRTAWRDALSLVGLKQSGTIQRGPGPSGLQFVPAARGAPIMPMLWNTDPGNAYSSDTEDFGSNRLVITFHFDQGQITNGTYLLAFPGTNAADITVNFEN